MPAVAEPRGLKRICMGCGMRFYDLNKRPIICPGCKAEFMIEVKTKGRKTRIANDEVVVAKVAVVEVAKETEEIEVVAGEEDVVSLEDVDEDDDDDDDLALDDDIGDLDDLEKDGEEEEKEEVKE